MTEIAQHWQHDRGHVNAPRNAQVEQYMRASALSNSSSPGSPRGWDAWIIKHRKAFRDVDAPGLQAHNDHRGWGCFMVFFGSFHQ
jgi:hypothetical protein